MLNLGKIIAAYIGKASSYQRNLRAFLISFERLPTIEKAIEKAICNNHPHQNCLSWKKREVVAKKLFLSASLLDSQSSFEGIFDTIASCVEPTFLKADLLIYDLSLRIAAYRKIVPSLVYLHNGALKGAQFVLRQKKLPRALPLKAFPPEFIVLSPHEVEDCLCIYKSDFEMLSKLGLHT